MMPTSARSRSGFAMANALLPWLLAPLLFSGPVHPAAAAANAAATSAVAGAGAPVAQAPVARSEAPWAIDAGRPVEGAGVALALEGAELGALDGDGFRVLRMLPTTDRERQENRPAQVRALSLRPAAGGSGSWSLARARSLKIHLQNAMEWPLTAGVELVDAHGNTLRTRIGLKPGAPLTLVVPLTATSPRRWGMSEGPPMPVDSQGVPTHVALAVDGSLDLERVAQIRLTMPRPDAEQRLRVGKLFAEYERDEELAAYTGIVDGYGQYTGAEWPGKWSEDPARAPANAAVNAAAEKAVADKAAAARGNAGGRAPAAVEVAQQAASSEPRRFFTVDRIARREGGARRVLRAPDGSPFMSLGVNAVQLAGNATFTAGREFMFASLPGGGGFAPFRGRDDSAAAGRVGAQKGREYDRGATFDFYRANLFRLDGNDFEKAWTERTSSRLQQWGFNTLGAWTDEAFVERSRMPYTQIVHVQGDFATLSDGNDWWGAIADPFDPRFAQAVKKSLQRAVPPRRDDPRLIGWFVDNELGWGDGNSREPARRLALALSALRSDGWADHGHAKRAFVEMLRAKYTEAARLAIAWDRPIGSWDALLQAMPAQGLPDPSRAAVAEDLSLFLKAHAERYFSTVSAQLKALDPNHLYLGARFSARTPEALAACARYCDVISFNLYIPSLNDGFDAEAFRKLDKPALLTEFHFGATNAGPFWPGMLPVPVATDRGPAYERMIASVVANPDFVGAHWFQYVDQPVTGRLLDGENGNVGLVSITDRPWPGLVQAALEANGRAAEAMAGLQAPDGPAPEAKAPVPASAPASGSDPAPASAADTPRAAAQR